MSSGGFSGSGLLPANSGGGGGSYPANPTFNSVVDSGTLQLAAVSTPSAPTAGNTVMYGTNEAGRVMPAFLSPVGDRSLLQPLIARKRVMSFYPQCGSNAAFVLGFLNSNVGTLTGRVPTSTNYFQQGSRVGFVSSGAGAGTAGVRSAIAGPFWLGNAAGLGGFFVSWRFGISDASLVATGRTFVGLGGTAAPTDVNPSTLTNVIGIGNDNGDTTMQLYASGAVAQARTSLGANFPAQTTKTDVYELTLFAQPNATSVTYQVTRLNTGDVATGTISVAANLPSNTTFLALQAWRSEGGTATATGLDIFNMYAECDI